MLYVKCVCVCVLSRYLSTVIDVFVIISEMKINELQKCIKKQILGRGWTKGTIHLSRISLRNRNLVLMLRLWWTDSTSSQRMEECFN